VLAAASVGWHAFVGSRHSAGTEHATPNSRDDRASVLASFSRRDATAVAGPKELPDLVVPTLPLDRATAEDLGTVRLRSGSPHRLVLARKQNGDSCLLDIGPANVGTGCGHDLFLGRSIAWTEGFDGGPSADTMSNYHVVGVAKPEVRAI